MRFQTSFATRSLTNPSDVKRKQLFSQARFFISLAILSVFFFPHFLSYFIRCFFSLLLFFRKSHVHRAILRWPECANCFSSRAFSRARSFRESAEPTKTQHIHNDIVFSHFFTLFRAMGGPRPFLTVSLFSLQT